MWVHRAQPRSYQLSQTRTASCPLLGSGVRVYGHGSTCSRGASMRRIVLFRWAVPWPRLIGGSSPGTAAPDAFRRSEIGPGERGTCARNRARGGGRAHSTSLPPWPGAPASTRRGPVARSQRLGVEPPGGRRPLTAAEADNSVVLSASGNQHGRPCTHRLVDTSTTARAKRSARFPAPSASPSSTVYAAPRSSASSRPTCGASRLRRSPAYIDASAGSSRGPGCLDSPDAGARAGWLAVSRSRSSSRSLRR